MLFRLFALVLALFAAVPAAAQSSDSLAGTWALKYEGTAIFRFDVKRSGDDWSGTWWRPNTFGIGPEGATFYQVSGPAVQVKSGESRRIGEWLEFTFPDPRPKAVPDVFRLRLMAPDRAELIYADTGLPAFTLERAPADMPPGPWDVKRSYRKLTVAALGLPDAPDDEQGRSEVPSAKTGAPLRPRDTATLPPVVGR